MLMWEMNSRRLKSLMALHARKLEPMRLNMLNKRKTNNKNVVSNFNKCSIG